MSDFELDSDSATQVQTARKKIALQRLYTPSVAVNFHTGTPYCRPELRGLKSKGPSTEE